MTKQTETMRLALELKNSASAYWTEKEISIIEKLIELLAQTEQPAQPASEADKQVYKAIADNYHASLQPAQLEQKPIAWMYDWVDGNESLQGWIAHKESEIPKLLATNIRPLYAKRTWVGLTDEDIQKAVTKAVRERKLSWFGFKKDEQGTYTIPSLSPPDYQMARCVEAKLKEKNA